MLAFDDGLTGSQVHRHFLYTLYLEYGPLYIGAAMVAAHARDAIATDVLSSLDS